MATDHIKKWQDWLTRIENEQLRDLVISHYIFERFRAVVKPLNGSTHRADLAAWISQGQNAFICAAIRRLTEEEKDGKKKAKKKVNKKGKKKDEKDIISLRKLLDDMALNSDLLTRTQFTQMYDNSVAKKFADRDFDQLAGQGANVFLRSTIDEDVKQMVSRVEQIKVAMDKIVAHTEQNRSLILAPPTYGQLNRIVVWLQKLFAKYYILINARKYSAPRLNEFDLTADFEDIFIPR